ncbi:MAG: nucleotide exchange factor GrpE [Pseudomonadota bacterium]
MTQGEHRPNPEEAQPVPDAAAETPHTAHGAPEVVGLHDETFGVGGVLTARLVEAQSKLAEMQDAYLRAKAEADNTRRRAQEDIAKAHKFAVESFAESLLPVKDSLEMALKVETPSIDSLKEGVDMTLKQLVAAFDKHRLVEVNPQPGEKLDPMKHQAISMVPAEQEANTIVSVLQKGYMISDRLLRPALVTVSQAA